MAIAGYQMANNTGSKFALMVLKTSAHLHIPASAHPFLTLPYN